MATYKLAELTGTLEQGTEEWVDALNNSPNTLKLRLETPYGEEEGVSKKKSATADQRAALVRLLVKDDERNVASFLLAVFTELGHSVKNLAKLPIGEGLNGGIPLARQASLAYGKGSDYGQQNQRKWPRAMLERVRDAGLCDITFKSSSALLEVFINKTGMRYLQMVMRMPKSDTAWSDYLAVLGGLAMRPHPDMDGSWHSERMVQDAALLNQFTVYHKLLGEKPLIAQENGEYKPLWAVCEAAQIALRRGWHVRRRLNSGNLALEEVAEEIRKKRAERAKPEEQAPATQPAPAPAPAPAPETQQEEQPEVCGTRLPAAVGVWLIDGQWREDDEPPLPVAALWKGGGVVEGSHCWLLSGVQAALCDALRATLQDDPHGDATITHNGDTYRFARCTPEHVGQLVLYWGEHAKIIYS